MFSGRTNVKAGFKFEAPHLLNFTLYIVHCTAAGQWYVHTYKGLTYLDVTSYLLSTYDDWSQQ